MQILERLVCCLTPNNGAESRASCCEHGHTGHGRNILPCTSAIEAGQRRYHIGCDNFGATLQHQLLVQCSLLAARCQHLVLFDVVRAGVEFTNMKMDTLSLGLVGPGFRCQCVVIFRVIPPRKSLADAIYYEARTTMFLKRLMDVGSPTRTRSSAWWMARHRNISLKSRSLPLRNQSVSGSWVPHKRQRIQRLWDRDC